MASGAKRWVARGLIGLILLCAILLLVLAAFPWGWMKGPIERRLSDRIGKPVTIGKGCTIGHKAIIHGCTIGDNSLIGMGATVLNGAKIGKNCLVGANALVTEGKEFPDNSLIVGAPAKAIRTLDDDAIEGLRQSALRYIANWQRFARELKEI